MKPYRYHLISFLLSFVFISSGVACGRSASGQSDPGSELDAVSDSVIDASRIASADSVAPDTPPSLSFDSAEEALEYMRHSPDRSKYMSGILPRMASDELSYCTRLLNNPHSGFIIVDKNRMKVILYDKFGNIRHSYGMACARNYGTKHKKADSRTPEGFFEVEGIYDSTDWLFTDDNGVQSKKKGQFGPRFIRLKTPVSSQIGIHGTCAPWSIGGRSSHGCIRITNENILQLVELVEKGMPVIVSPGKKDIAVNEREGYSIPAVATTPGGNKAEYIPDIPEQKESENESVQMADPDSAATSADSIHSPAENHSVPDSLPGHAPERDRGW